MDLKKTTLPLFFGTIFSMVGFAQTIENVTAAAEGSKIIITYDLVSTDDNQKFDIELFSSHNDFEKPALLVKGDVGENIKPGAGKRVEWNARAELRNFKGQVSVEVRGQVKKPMYTFLSPKAKSGLRKGKPASIVWEGGSDNQRFKLELVQNDVVIQGLGTVPNTGLYTWTVPTDTKTGKGYRFRITAGDEVVDSQEFSVKGKTPLWVMLSPIPVVAAGGTLFYLWYAEQQRLKDHLAIPPDVSEIGN